MLLLMMLIYVTMLITGPPATNMILVGDLVPAGTMLVTPDLDQRTVCSKSFLSFCQHSLYFANYKTCTAGLSVSGISWYAFSRTYARGGWGYPLLELDILQKLYYLRKGD